MSSQLIHNVRFYNVEPTAINCMSYNKDTKKLALSRSDNSIEIWDLSHTPHIDRVIQGTSSGSVESLVWCAQGERLFSSGLNGMIVEYDLLKLLPKYSTPVTSGACWCMDINRENTMLAAGTEDGYINLFHIEEDSLMYNKILDKQEGRIMCLTWDVSGERLATGSEDSVRIWSVKSGHATHKMTTGRAVTNRPTIVWAIAATDDFTVITGDSRGKLCLWDGNAGTSVASHQSHKADVLCLCLDDPQTTVYAAGVDPLIATFERVRLRAEPDSAKWVRSIQRRIHDHDVRALAFAHGRLFSGGVDGYLSLSSYPPKVLLRYPPLLQPPSVCLAADARCLLLRHPLHLELWRLADHRPNYRPHPLKLVTVVARDQQRVRCAAVSPDARWLAYSTDTLFRLYSVELPTSSEEGAPRMSRVRGLSAECSAVHTAAFSPDSGLLVCATSCAALLTFQLSADAGPSLLHTFNPKDDNLMSDVIHLLAVSADNRFIVAADRSNNIVIWSNGKHFCSLPRYHCAPTAMAIHPTTNNLVVVYCDHKIVEYSVESRKYTKFSRKLTDNHPKQWLARSFPVNNIVFDPANDNIIMMHDDSTICVVDKLKSLPSTDAKIPRLESSYSPSPSMLDLSAQESSNQHHPPSHCSQFAFHVVKKYKHLVYLGCVADSEMVAVEVNPLTLVEKLPPSLKQKQFGAM